MKKLFKFALVFMCLIALPVLTYASSNYSTYSSYSNYSNYNSSLYSDSTIKSDLTTEEQAAYDKLGKSNDFNIISYDIDMKINLDNSFDITEKITAYFDTLKHGIKRNIPLKNEVKSESGSTTNRARISNIKVSDPYEIESESGETVLKIGSASKYVSGKKEYTISYHYDLGKDRFPNFDELYFNIIGTSWTCKITNVKFKIEMPSEFDKSKLGFSTGSYGYSGYEDKDLSYTVTGNTISGTYTGILRSGQGITVRCELPDGYFSEAKDNMLIQIIVRSIIIIIATIFGIIVWAKIGKDDPIVETVEFYPPKGMNSLEVGLFYKEGGVDKKDAISLLIYLASKGFIKIEETEEKGVLGNKKSYKIIKVKEYNGKNPEEREFFNGLFARKDVVTKKDLENKFYKTIDSVISNVKKENKDTIWTKESRKKRWWVALSIAVIYIAAITGSVTSIEDIITGFGEFIVAGFVMVGFWPIWLVISLCMNNAKGRAITLSLIGAGLTFIGSISSLYDERYFIVVGLGIIGMVTCMIMFNIAKKRMPEQTERLGKLRGFKNFLETAEKEKLEALVEDDPQYFYNILPFTYVLGVSNKWIKKFEDIAMEPPEWYSSNDGVFNYIMFDHFMNSTLTSISTNMTSTPSSSGSGGGGGGFSGGGFSGGGSGGGGGSSW